MVAAECDGYGSGSPSFVGCFSCRQARHAQQQVTVSGQFLMLPDIYIWRNLGGYWGNSAEWSPLTHTWSLGIEEQFYLFFPCSLLLLARFQPSRVGSWLIAAAVLSFGICLHGTYRHPVPTFSSPAHSRVGVADWRNPRGPPNTSPIRGKSVGASTWSKVAGGVRVDRPRHDPR